MRPEMSTNGNCRVTASYGRVRADGATCAVVPSILQTAALVAVALGVGLGIGQVSVPYRYQNNALLLVAALACALGTVGIIVTVVLQA